MAQDNIASTATIEDRSAKVDGHSIRYLSAGDSDPTIVMVHGGGGNRWEWVDSMSSLASHYRVVAPDLIGFGDSPRGGFTHTTEYLSEFLTSFLDTVGIERATLVGHSPGGRVCLEVALRRSQIVEGLVLIAPLGFGRLSSLGRLLSTGAWWANRLLRRRQPFPNLEIRLEEPDMSVFAGVGCDTLLIWGSKDPYFPLAHSARAVKAIPNARLYVYDGAGHAVHRSHLDRFESDVRDFVRGR